MTPPEDRRTVAQHVDAALALVAPLPVVEHDLDAALGRVLASDVVSLLDSPASDSSAMDGYAVRTADVRGATPTDPVTLRVVADVPAGGPGGPAGVDGGPGAAGPRIGPGEAARIMTGAVVPAGADAVVPVEETSTGRFVPGSPASPDSWTGTVTLPVAGRGGARRTHVRARGEDVRRGDVVLGSGTRLSARHVSVAASAGYATLPVHREPRVAVVSTGSELVAAGTVPGPGMLPDSNSVLVAAAARSLGAHVVRRGAVGDTVQALGVALDEVLSGAWPDGAVAPPDLVVTTGGVSAGAFDVVRGLLDPATRAGTPWADAVTDAQLVAVGMQPGKPQGLARWRGVPWLALPGNPVSAFVSFELFVRPVVDRLRGCPEPRRALVTRVAGEGWASPPGREQLVLVRHAGPDDARVVLARPVQRGREGSGSHRLSALAVADAVAVVPADVTALAEGDAVRVLLLD
ncbi:gephyrin-like molybdotransferase Glp [Cellulosimicrobium sp. Marseille-Q4280]|uniref:molybdopterin molybdotransferase MoeA n=1 Tax=Cellulosimicrobium sp. Marseille-Q4280 TaxID=2937992 RepID=UPI002041A2BC|nr:gephyrin-like molybdotransferase Glp [Cellulosimicrobium sp. Marseille-Q4280]